MPADHGAAVRAGVVEDVHLPGLRAAHHEQRLAADRPPHVVARAGHLGLVTDIEPGVAEDPVRLFPEDLRGRHRIAVHAEPVPRGVIVHHGGGAADHGHRRLPRKLATRWLKSSARSIWVQWPHRANTARSASGSRRTMFHATSTGTTLSSRPCMSSVRVATARTSASVMLSSPPACRGLKNMSR